ncbi:MAG: S8 family serine peptidase [Pirellulales bacterium]
MGFKRSKTQPESDFSYFDKFKQRTVQFRPKGDEVVATLRTRGADDEEHFAAAEKTLTEVVDETSLAFSRGGNADLGVGVYRVPEQMRVEDAATRLRAVSSVANAIPAFVDDEGNSRYLLPDELTVQFNDDVAADVAEKFITDKGSRVLVRQRTRGYYTISVPTGKGLFETIHELNQLPEVRFAEGSEMGFDDALTYFPDDPRFSELWGLHNVGQTGGTIDADVDAPEAWDLERGHPQVIVAVLDTGVDIDHPDLAANLLPRGAEDWDFSDPNSQSPDDSDGHGTHVAGTTAAVDNSAGVIGVAHRCRIMPLKIDLTAGMNQNRADAINYVTDQALANPGRRYIINASWRTSGNMTAVESAIIHANNNNVLPVFAAGNTDGGAVTYPARYPQTVAVANTDHNDRISSSSAVGSEVDVSAPGTAILSTVLNGGYGLKSGTSMASPHAAGVAALIWSRNPRLTNQQVRNILENTCDNIDALNPGMAGLIGRGRVNAFRAVRETPLPVTPVRSFPFPQINNGDGSGLAFAPNLPNGAGTRHAIFFLTQRPFSERIHFLDPQTGTPFATVVPVGNDTIGCLEWNGTSILAANVFPNGWIKRINPTTGAEEGKIRVPSGRGHGLALRGTRLYYSTVAKVHEIDAATGQLVSQFPAPGGNCYSLAAEAGRLFCGNSERGVVTVYDVVNHFVVGEFAVPGGGARRVDGLALDPTQKELFVANQSTNTIHVLHLEF